MLQIQKKILILTAASLSPLKPQKQEEEEEEEAYTYTLARISSLHAASC